MGNMELLLGETKDICNTNDIEFEWMRSELILCYVLEFKRLGKILTLWINERDLYIKPLSTIKIEIKRMIQALIDDKV
jgi:hypothetical protein